MDRSVSQWPQDVQPPNGPSLDHLRIFPAALKEAHFLKTTERSIQGPVRGQDATRRQIAEAFRQLVPVKLIAATKP